MYVVLAVSIAMLALAAQDVLDRVLARVEGIPIMLSDARAAVRLGLVTAPKSGDPIAAAMQNLIERRLVLTEVDRFAPVEPDATLLNGQLNALQAHVGGAAELAALEKSTGYGEAKIREVARDNLRIQSYLNQRFGTSVQPTDEEVGQYYRTHLDEFTVNGRILPFVEAEPQARQKAAAERRRSTIDQWLRELRQRAEVVEVYSPK
jgi:hypothetical protein